MTIRQLTISLLFSAVAAGAVAAQGDPKKPGTSPMPEPKHKQHDALQAFVGTWDVTMHSEAMPGVKGMEKAMDCTGTENCELLNNGLWLKATSTGTSDGKPFQGLWLAGYDPFAKQYVCHCVSSDEQCPGLCTMTGTFDDAKKSWTWSGHTPQGDMRSVMVASNPDSVVETCFMIGADGKEQKFMEITRKRSSRTPAPSAADANAAKTDKSTLPKELAGMQQDVGSWDAVVRCSGMPGQPASEEKATERVSTVCGGKWLWTDFAGRMQGQPFEGHALTGYDPSEKKVVMLWIDSMSPVSCKTTGAGTAGDKELVLEGKCTDPAGQPMTIKQRLTRPDASTRAMQMESKCSQGDTKLDISYRRKS
jgi:hypothetical protein